MIISRLPSGGGGISSSITVTTDTEDLIGKEVFLYFDGSLVDTQVFDENKIAIFNKLKKLGMYTISCEGVDEIVELKVIGQSKEVIVNLVIYNIANWCKSGGVTERESLAEIPEVDIRRLMTIHASVDFLKEWMNTEPTIVDTFVANANAMKWMGLRDYAYDTLTSGVSGLESKILASNNWEYALKDHIPVMTSDTTPYGEASAKTTFVEYGRSYIPANAFGLRGSAYSGYWASLADDTSPWLQYKFPNPICVKKYALNTTVTILKSYKIQGSNDGVTWTDLYIATDVEVESDDLKTINNDEYYLYMRVSVSSWTNKLNLGWCGITKLQFYGRYLNVSVPKMTSNTEPYGEILASGEYDEHVRQHAFNNVLSDIWGEYMTNSPWIGYKFPSKINVKKIAFMVKESTSGSAITQQQPTKIVVDYSNDGISWESATDILDVPVNVGEQKWMYYPIAININANYWRMRIVANNGSVLTSINEMQIFGVDYSEREFAEGSTIKYIYDHGIQFMPIETSGFPDDGGYTVTSPIFESDSIVFNPSGTVEHALACKMDLTPYKTIRVMLGNYSIVTDNVLSVGTLRVKDTKTFGSADARLDFYLRLIPNSLNLDISNINAIKYISYQTYPPQKCSFAEWWLE